MNIGRKEEFLDYPDFKRGSHRFFISYLSNLYLIVVIRDFLTVAEIS